MVDRGRQLKSTALERISVSKVALSTNVYPFAYIYPFFNTLLRSEPLLPLHRPLLGISTLLIP